MIKEDVKKNVVNANQFISVIKTVSEKHGKYIKHIAEEIYLNIVYNVEKFQIKN